MTTSPSCSSSTRGGGFVEGDVAELHGTMEAGHALADHHHRGEQVLQVPGRPPLARGGRASASSATPSSNTSRTRRSPSPMRASAATPGSNSTATSRLFATDMVSAGRIAFGPGETFRFASLDSSFEIVVDGATVAHDRLIADDAAEVAALQRLWQGAFHTAHRVRLWQRARRRRGGGGRGAARGAAAGGGRGRAGSATSSSAACLPTRPGTATMQSSHAGARSGPCSRASRRGPYGNARLPVAAIVGDCPRRGHPAPGERGQEGRSADGYRPARQLHLIG